MSAALPLPAIVLPAYQRPGAFKALLDLLAQAQYPDGGQVPLHISLEHGHDPLVRSLAEEFPWPHGPKRVVLQPARLGLRAHILLCGDLSAEYGHVLILEDDLLVAPGFYLYAQAALAACTHDARVAGVGLYRYQLSEQHRLPFVPSSSPADDHYIQLPCSWGQAFSAAQWRAFRDWQQPQQEADIDRLVPAYVRAWGAQSWKRVYMAYLRAYDRFFLYPSAALSTHPGHAGTHADAGSVMQASLEMGMREWRFAGLDAATGVYDAWMEPLPRTLKAIFPEIADGALCVDLYGQKEPEAWTGEWLLTTRTSLLAEQRFDHALWPPIANVLMRQSGDFIRLARRADVLPAPVAAQDWLAFAPTAVTAAASLLTGRAPISFSVVMVNSPAYALDDAVVVGALAQFPATEVILVEPEGASYAPGILFHPQVRRIVATSTDPAACIFQGMQAATGTWLLPLLSGQHLYHGSLGAISHILLQSPEIEWLACLPLPSRRGSEEDLRRMRWDATQARFAGAQRLFRSLQPGQLIVRRVRWRQLAESVPTGDWLGALQGLFSKVPLHVALLSLNKHPFEALAEPRMQRRRIALPPGEGGLRGLGAYLTRWAYVHNVPVLRQVHLALSHYPKVVRRNADDGPWFRSEY